MSERDAVETSDADLIRQALEGNDTAFEQLVSRHRPRVFQIASRYARNEHELADLAQESFVKACFALRDYRGDAPFEHWLSRIAVRTCYDHLRARKRRAELPVSELTDEQERWLERASAEDAFQKEDELAAAKEARELLEIVLGQLSPADRMVITLLELEERPVREIAALMGWSQTLVKVRAFRARKAMKKIIERLQP